MKLRRAIIANTPHLETASGSDIHLMKAQRAKMPECVIEFLPDQAGSGDPSRTNVRLISGWDGVDLFVCPSTSSDNATYTVSWASIGMLYGGYIDLVNGTLTKTHGIMDLGTLNWGKSSSGIGERFYATEVPWYSRKINMDIQCTAFLPDGYGNRDVGYYGANGTIRYYLPSANLHDSARELYVVDSAYSSASASAFKASVNGVMLTYELFESQTYQLSPQVIKTLAGENYIWTNANNGISIKYWSH